MFSNRSIALPVVLGLVLGFSFAWSRIKTKLPVTLQLADAAAARGFECKSRLVLSGIQPGRTLMNSVWELVQE